MLIKIILFIAIYLIIGLIITTGYYIIDYYEEPGCWESIESYCEWNVEYDDIPTCVFILIWPFILIYLIVIGLDHFVKIFIKRVLLGINERKKADETENKTE